MANNDDWVRALLGAQALRSPGVSALFGDGLPVQPATKRKVYFAFRYKDIMRVNNVRQSGKIGQEQETNPRDFYDRSIWEKSGATEPETLKRLMREGVEHSSVVCVLNCTDTWESRWVKYEVARAVIDKKGLLNVNIAGLKHHQKGVGEVAGLSPLSVMGVCLHANGSFYLCEQKLVLKSVYPAKYEWEWFYYDDHKTPVTIPPYLAVPAVGRITILATGTASHEYVLENGVANLGTWLDAAAKQVGR
jgi:MTH538 TIR-like domain (DUF1863)